MVISSIKNRYKNFFLDVMTLAGATTVAKIIGLLLVPVVSRLYDPSDFGVVVLILTIGAVFGAISALRYDHAIILPDNDYIALKLVKLSFILVLITGCLFFFLYLYC